MVCLKLKKTNNEKILMNQPIYCNILIYYMYTHRLMFSYIWYRILTTMRNKREGIYYIKASAARGGRTNSRIPLHRTYKTYTIAMTTTTGNTYPHFIYIYIYDIYGYTTNTIYYYLLLCPSLSPQGPLKKRALA